MMLLNHTNCAMTMALQVQGGSHHQPGVSSDDSETTLDLCLQRIKTRDSLHVQSDCYHEVTEPKT